VSGTRDEAAGSGAPGGLDPGSRKRLTAGAAIHFPDDTLFGRVARAVCAAEVLPRKELFESWAVATRVRRRLDGGRVVDLAAGHGVLAWMMLVLDPRSPGALAVDTRTPASAVRLDEALGRAFPRLAGKVVHVEADLASIPLSPDDVVVSAHACGGLTDRVLGLAVAARAPVAVLPCCQARARSDLGGLDGWLDPALAIDVTRVARLRAAGYAVHTQHIPPEITPKNRLLVARPA
jgi:hypothetical protein